VIDSRSLKPAPIAAAGSIVRNSLEPSAMVNSGAVCGL
jgi:hypothetical protein